MDLKYTESYFKILRTCGRERKGKYEVVAVHKVRFILSLQKWILGGYQVVLYSIHFFLYSLSFLCHPSVFFSLSFFSFLSILFFIFILIFYSVSLQLLSMYFHLSFRIQPRENKDDGPILRKEPQHLSWPFLRAKIFPWAFLPILKVYG